MAKKKKSPMEEQLEQEEAGGEQLDLIDIAPKEAKPIVGAARVYKKLQKIRLAALDKEVEQKQKVLKLVHKANLQPDDEGKIKFKYEGIVITVKPTKESITIKDESESDATS
jgi:hypothetical protein